MILRHLFHRLMQLDALYARVDVVAGKTNVKQGAAHH